jgi:hypothetical protein
VFDDFQTASNSQGLIRVSVNRNPWRRSKLSLSLRAFFRKPFPGTLCWDVAQMISLTTVIAFVCRLWRGFTRGEGYHVTVCLSGTTTNRDLFETMYLLQTLWLRRPYFHKACPVAELVRLRSLRNDCRGASTEAIDTVVGIKLVT